MFYSAQTAGFYDPAIHGANIPADAVEVTREDHAELIAGQSAGQIITTDSDGRPILQDPPPTEITGRDVDAERDRRIYDTFSFQGKRYDCDKDSLARITGAAALAGFAMGAGAQPGSLTWHGGDQPFAWIANDNSLNTMDAQTVFAFGQAAAAHQSAHVFAARQLKDQSPIPADFADDGYWP